MLIGRRDSFEEFGSGGIGRGPRLTQTVPYTRPCNILQVRFITGAERFFYNAPNLIIASHCIISAGFSGGAMHRGLRCGSYFSRLHYAWRFKSISRYDFMNCSLHWFVLTRWNSKADQNTIRTPNEQSSLVFFFLKGFPYQ